MTSKIITFSQKPMCTSTSTIFYHIIMQILVLKRCMACAAHAMNKGHCNACTLKPAF